MKYLKRVSSELEVIKGGPEEEELMLQGVRFAFRVHQVRAWLLLIQLWKTSACTIREQFMPHSMLSLGHAKALDTPRSLHAVCRWIRRGHHASLPGAQGEGVHVPDTTAEAAPSSAAAQTRCQGLMRSVRTRTCSSYMVDLSIRHHLVVATVAYYDLLIFFSFVSRNSWGLSILLQTLQYCN
jgi:hypothetical protein